jgi:hypothetical protein
MHHSQLRLCSKFSLDYPKSKYNRSKLLVVLLDSIRTNNHSRRDHKSCNSQCQLLLLYLCRNGNDKANYSHRFRANEDFLCQNISSYLWFMHSIRANHSVDSWVIQSFIRSLVCHSSNRQMSLNTIQIALRYGTSTCNQEDRRAEDKWGNGQQCTGSALSPFAR